MKEGWEYRKLGEFIEEFSVRDKGKGYPVYSVTNTKGFCQEFFGKNVASEDTSNYKVVPRGCFAYNPSRINVGSVAWQNQEENVSVSPLYVVFSVSPKLRKDFLLYYIKSNYSMTLINALSRGAVRNNLRLSTLKTFDIPYASISEQQRVVEELDLLSSIIEKKKAQLIELDNLAQSLFYEMFGDPITNDKGWLINSLKDVCSKISDGTHNSPVNEDKGDYMYVTAKNIKKDGIVLDNITFVSYDVHKSIYERCNPEFGDILYIKDGATTGIATINTLHDEFSLLSSVALLKPSNTIINQYLKAVLNTPNMYNVIRFDMGGAAITRLTIAKINKIRIPLPPIDLQQKFASKIEAIEHQKELIKQSIKEVETLFNSRMDYYFN